MLDGNLSCHMFYQDDDSIVILDKYPIDNGHSLIITKKPYEKITDMNVDEVAKLFSMLMQLSRQLTLMHSALHKTMVKLLNKLYHMYMFI